MKKIKLYILILILIPTVGFSQNCSDEYYFIKSIIGENPSGYILKEDGSSNVYNYIINKDNGIDSQSCFFIDNKYYNQTIWDTLITKADIEYFEVQIKKYNEFKWDSNKLHKDVILYSKKEAKKYSKEVMKYTNGKSNNKDFKLLEINSISIPLFNRNHNFAIVYHGSYVGPEGSFSAAYIFIKINEIWVRIGTLNESMS